MPNQAHHPPYTLVECSMALAFALSLAFSICLYSLAFLPALSLLTLWQYSLRNACSPLCVCKTQHVPLCDVPIIGPTTALRPWTCARAIHPTSHSSCILSVL